jgi:hypothetical protein
VTSKNEARGKGENLYPNLDKSWSLVPSRSYARLARSPPANIDMQQHIQGMLPL